MVLTVSAVLALLLGTMIYRQWHIIRDYYSLPPAFREVARSGFVATNVGTLLSIVLSVEVVRLVGQL